MVHTEYLRRNLVLCSAYGANANAKAAIKRLQAMKRPPFWLLEALQGIEERTALLPTELAAWRNIAHDRPDSTL